MNPRPISWTLGNLTKNWRHFDHVQKENKQFDNWINYFGAIQPYLTLTQAPRIFLSWNLNHNQPSGAHLVTLECKPVETRSNPTETRQTRLSVLGRRWLWLWFEAQPPCSGNHHRQTGPQFSDTWLEISGGVVGRWRWRNLIQGTLDTQDCGIRSICDWMVIIISQS